MGIRAMEGVVYASEGSSPILCSLLDYSEENSSLARLLRTEMLFANEKNCIMPVEKVKARSNAKTTFETLLLRKSLGSDFVSVSISGKTLACGKGAMIDGG